MCRVYEDQRLQGPGCVLQKTPFLWIMKHHVRHLYSWDNLLGPLQLQQCLWVGRNASTWVAFCFLFGSWKTLSLDPLLLGRDLKLPAFPMFFWTWGPTQVHLYLFTLRNATFFLFCSLFSGFMILLNGKEQGEMYLCYLCGLEVPIC